MYFVVMVPKSPETRIYCYGPFSEERAKKEKEQRKQFYATGLKGNWDIYLTKVESENQEYGDTLSHFYRD